MKSKEQQETTRYLAKSVLRLIPPFPPKVSITNGPEFARDMRKVLSKYVTSLPVGSQIFQPDFLQAPLHKPLFGDFLVPSQSLSPQEPMGTFLFLFKLQEQANLDIVLTPVSFYKLAHADPESFPEVHRAAYAWYGEDSGFNDTFSNLEQLIVEGSFHRFLRPVGPLVENVHSTFVNRVVSVVKGEVLSKTNPLKPLKFTVPSNLYIDLDSFRPPFDDYEPNHLKTTIYACIIYVRVNTSPAMNLFFVRSGKSCFEVKDLLIQLFEDMVRHKLAVTQQDLYINRLTFGAFCTLGYCSSQTSTAQVNHCAQRLSLPTIEIPDFISAPGSWQIFL